MANAWVSNLKRKKSAYDVFSFAFCISLFLRSEADKDVACQRFEINCNRAKSPICARKGKFSANRKFIFAAYLLPGKILQSKNSGKVRFTLIPQKSVKGWF